MLRKVFIVMTGLLLCCVLTQAQNEQKSRLHQTAETESEKGNVAASRYNYIRAYEDYFNKGQLRPGVECAAKATVLYYKENYYEEAFDLLRMAEQNVIAKKVEGPARAALFYVTAKERFNMYLRLRKAPQCLDQLKILEMHAGMSNDEGQKDDLLYTKAIYYYTFGQNAKGNAVFKEMAKKLTASKEYDKVEEAYKTMIANGRRSNNASMVAQSYSSYIAWKDSAMALKMADERAALKKQISDNEATIADMDSSLTTRQAIIIGLCVLAAALAAALVVGGIILLRYIMLTRKQKKTINLANENNALKAKFISNISAQLEPTLQQLDSTKPAVKALLDFSSHIQTLSELENRPQEEIELEETQIPAFCESLMDEIRDKVKSGVTLKVNAPKMSASLNKEYVSHILLHLLNNAAEYTPENGTITIDFKKRGAHTHQFLVSDTGCGIAEEMREDLFKPFTEVRDLTKGDGLGLPICKQMALKMNGDLEIDQEYSRGTRFVLELHA